MLKSVTGEFLQYYSYFIFRSLVLFVRELFLCAFVIVYPCVQFAILIGICNIKFNGIGCYVAIYITNIWSLANRNMRRNWFLIIDVMFVFAINRTRKPDVNIFFLRIGFNFLKCNSIRSLDCFKGRIFICLTPNSHHTILPICDIECNFDIILRFFAPHLSWGCSNIANDRSKRSLIRDVQFAVFCIICPDAICVVIFPVARKSFY